MKFSIWCGFAEAPSQGCHGQLVCPCGAQVAAGSHGQASCPWHPKSLTPCILLSERVSPYFLSLSDVIAMSMKSKRFSDRWPDADAKATPAAQPKSNRGWLIAATALLCLALTVAAYFIIKREFHPTYWTAEDLARFKSMQRCHQEKRRRGWSGFRAARFGWAATRTSFRTPRRCTRFTSTVFGWAALS